MIDKLQLMVANTTNCQLGWEAHKRDKSQLEHAKLERLQMLEGSQDRKIATLEATSKTIICFKVHFVQRSKLQFPGEPD